MMISVGDVILMGRFKNKKVTVKTIGYDEHGMPTINGKPACTFRKIKWGIYNHGKLHKYTQTIYHGTKNFCIGIIIVLYINNFNSII